MDVGIFRTAHLRGRWLDHGEYAHQGVRIRIQGRTDYSYL